MPIYQNEKEIKDRMHKAGLTIRDLAIELEIPPGTMSNQLGGWAPLTREYRRKIIELIERAEGKINYRNSLVNNKNGSKHDA